MKLLPAAYPASERRAWLQAIYHLYIESYKIGSPPLKQDKYLQDPNERMIYVIANQLEDLLAVLSDGEWSS